MHVVDMVFFWARTEPHRPAIVQPELVTTYQGLADAIDSICGRIDQLGLDKHEPIAVSIANPSIFVATVFAVLRSGYSAALVHPPLFLQLQPAGVRNLIYDAQGLVLSGGRNIRFDSSWLPSSPPATSRKPYRHRPLENVSLIRFTSGTTGLPKMHVLGRSAFENQVSCAAMSWANGSHTKALIMPGLASAFGFNRTCQMLFAGKAACFAPSPADALWLIDTFGIEAIFASPQQALGLAEIQETRTHSALESVRTLRIAGAAVPPEMGRRLRSQICRDIVVCYASTEAGTVATAQYAAIEETPHAVGFVAPDVELEITDETEVALPVGSEGWVRLRTPLLRLNASVRNPGPSDGKVDWFYPGDVGRLTEDGILCVTARNSDVINSGGVKVSAAKVEEIVQALPEIQEAAACGITGPSGLEELWVAVVAATEQPDVAAIKQHLQQHKEVGLAPARVILVDQLPRGDLGKLQRFRLKEQLLNFQTENG